MMMPLTLQKAACLCLAVLSLHNAHGFIGPHARSGPQALGKASLAPFQRQLLRAVSSETGAVPVGEEASVGEGMQQKENKPKKKKTPPPVAEVEIDVSKLDIRVGIINKAWEHEEADKLYCEEIDLGEEGGPRSIASGLKAHYSLDDLVGRKVLVLANLKSRKLVGFPSHGMVLCASSEDGTVKFIDPPVDSEIGERVIVEGFNGEPATENQIIKKKMLDTIFPKLKTNREGVATYDNIPLTTSAGPCVAADGLANAPIA